MKHFSQSIAVLLLATLGSPVAGIADDSSPRPFERIVGFGDSLSDPGNFFAVTGEQALAPYAPIPSSPYAIGGHHFSNGASWLEQLSTALRHPPSGKPAFRNARVFSNYAFGGARARAFGGSPDLATQVGVFLSDNGGRSLDDSLFVVWLGANDVRDSLNVLAANPGNVAMAFGILQSAIAATANNLGSLYAAGGREFLVVNVPNLGLLPAVKALGEPAVSTAAALSAAYNAGLGQALDQLGFLPNLTIHRFDVHALLDDIVVDPGAFGLIAVQTPCLRFGVVANAMCVDPDKFLFWDAIHPTTAAHGILAGAARDLIASATP